MRHCQRPPDPNRSPAPQPIKSDPRLSLPSSTYLPQTNNSTTSPRSTALHNSPYLSPYLSSITSKSPRPAHCFPALFIQHIAHSSRSPISNPAFHLRLAAMISPGIGGINYQINVVLASSPRHRLTRHSTRPKTVSKDNSSHEPVPCAADTLRCV